MKRMTRRLPLVVLAFVLLAASCSGNPEGPSSGVNVSYSAQMASSWHWVGDPQRVEIGLLGSGGEGTRVVTGGSIELSFDFLGGGRDDPLAGPSPTARFIPVPGSDPGGDAPALSTGNGVYEADGVVFDQAGVWRVS